MTKQQLRNLRLLDATLSFMIGWQLGLDSIRHFVKEPAIYQQIIWNIGVCAVLYVIIGIIIVAVTE